MYTIYYCNPGCDPEPLKTFVNHIAAIAYTKAIAPEKLNGRVSLVVLDNAGTVFFRIK